MSDCTADPKPPHARLLLYHMDRKGSVLEQPAAENVCCIPRCQCVSYLQDVNCIAKRSYTNYLLETFTGTLLQGKVNALRAGSTLGPGPPLSSHSRQTHIIGSRSIWASAARFFGLDPRLALSHYPQAAGAIGFSI
jgi:hypothetical protein